MITGKQFAGVIFMAVLCIAAVGNAANLVVNPGFETSEGTSNGLPNSYGDWEGDYSSIANASLGINPMGGLKMLQFLGTNTGGAGSTNTSDIFQIIDVSSYSALIASGNAVAKASVYFNRVAGDAQTDTKFGIGILAYDGSPSTFPSRFSASTYNSAITYDHVKNFYSDGLLGTWEKCEMTLNLPTNTTFIVVNLNLAEEVYNDPSYPEFDGHFADNVSLEIIPEPSTMIFLGAGLFGLLKRK